MEKKLNPEIDTTLFINIDDKDFVFYIGGQPREVKANEEKIMPVYVAQLGAKHLIDRILQEKHGIKNTLADTPLRRSLLLQILPQLAEMIDEKPLSTEDFQKAVQEQIEKQNKLISELSGSIKSNDEKDKEIAELKERLLKLEKEAKPKVAKNK